MSKVSGKRIAEWVKTALILLLTISAMLLGRQTGLFDEFVDAIPVFRNIAAFIKGAGTAKSDSTAASFKEAARPSAIVITNNDGGRFGVRGDVHSRNTAYDRTSSILGEALGSASVSLEISEDEWRAALQRSGVYYEYLSPVKLSILGGWLGARVPDAVGDVLLRRVCVAFTEDKSKVYYHNYANGLFYAAETASSYGKVHELEIYNENGALFAFETSVGAAENAPYMIILQGSEHPCVRAADAGSADELMDMVLKAMGNGNESFISHDSGGHKIRVGSQFNIRADELGRISYRSNVEIVSQSSEERLKNEIEMIEQARVVVADTLGSVGSSAEVFFESLEYVSDDVLSIYFVYYIAGGRIHLFAEGHAAKITFDGGVISELELNYRVYSLSGEFVRLLPEKQAMASAGGEFILCYSDKGADKMQPMWVRYY